MNQTDMLRDQYIALLKSVVTFSLWEGADGSVWRPRRMSSAARATQRLLDHFHLGVVSKVTPERRENGRYWPRLAHTMIGLKRMNNLEECLRTILREQVPGDVIETGVWRGGACIFMRGFLQAYGITDRTVWVADSFEGLPAPDPERYPADRGDKHHTESDLVVSLKDVQDNFRSYGLLDDQVRFLKGWFKDTLPTAPIEHLAIIRLDGDMYGSTMESLEALYPRLSPGGFVIVDDYGAVEGCRQAVEDFRDNNNILSPLVKIDWAGAYWRKSESAAGQGE